MNAISAIHSHAAFHRPSVTPPQTSPAQGRQDANPAFSARAALTDRPDLANKPFGSLVSLFAKGLPLPPMEDAGEVSTPTEPATVDSSETQAS